MQRIASHLLGVRVRVVAVGQQDHLHRHALSQQHVDAAQRRPDACRIPIENHRDVLGEPTNEVNLSRRERRAARRHHVFDPGLVHGHDVRVAFHKEASLLLVDGLFGQMHAIEHLGLVVQDALRRVEVLGDFFVRRQRSPAKPNDPARHIPDREHDTAFEEIPQRAVVPLFAQAGLHEFFGRVARLLRRCGHGVPRIRTVSNHERVKHVVAKPPFHEVAPSNGLAGVGVPHLVHEPLGRPSHEVGQAFLGGGGRQLLGRGRLFLHLDVVALRKHPQRLWVTGLFQFH